MSTDAEKAKQLEKLINENKEGLAIFLEDHALMIEKDNGGRDYILVLYLRNLAKVVRETETPITVTLAKED